MLSCDLTYTRKYQRNVISSFPLKTNIWIYRLFSYIFWFVCFFRLGEHYEKIIAKFEKSCLKLRYNVNSFAGVYMYASVRAYLFVNVFWVNLTIKRWSRDLLLLRKFQMLINLYSTASWTMDVETISIYSSRRQDKHVHRVHTYTMHTRTECTHVHSLILGLLYFAATNRCREEFRSKP